MESELKGYIENQDAALLYFSSPKCSACSALEPKIKTLVETKYPKISFIEIDVSQHPELAAHYSVFMAPTAIVVTEGKEAQRFARAFGLVEVQQTLDRIYPLIFG